MSANIYQYEDELKGTAKKWFETLKSTDEADAQIVRKAVQLYKQDGVEDFQFDGRTISGTVFDKIRFELEVNLKFLEMSSCTCASHYYCHHQIALFLRVYSEVDSVTKLIDSWKTTADLNSLKKQLGIRTASDLLKSNNNENIDIERWNEELIKRLNNDLLPTLKADEVLFLDNNFDHYLLSLNVVKRPKKDLKRLHNIFVALVTFKNLIPLIEDDSYSTYSCFQIFKRLTEIVVSNCNEINVHFIPASLDIIIENLLSETENLLAVSDIFDHLNSKMGLTFLNDIVAIYASLWDKLFKNSDWRDREVERLDTFIDKTDDELTYSFLHSVCQASLLFLKKSDEELFNAVPRLNSAVIVNMLDFTEKLIATQSWQRVSPFINFIINKSDAFITEYFYLDNLESFIRKVINVVHNYSVRQNDFSQYEKVIVKLLPFSFSDCEDYFFHKNDYEKWASLITFKQVNINEIFNYKIAAVKEAKPHLLLPLYHQSISKYISLKSRNNYRHAALLLKDLQELYISLNKSETWEAYFKLLLEKTRRLRAFHQECADLGLV